MTYLWGKLKKLLNRSVFKKIPDTASMNDIMAALFHRTAATTYFVYIAWAIVALTTGIPTLIKAQGEPWQLIFSALVFASAGPACFGATFWPLYAKLEALAGSSFVFLVALYLTFVTANVLQGDGSKAGLILLLSVLVIPSSRTIVIIWFLLKQAKAEKLAKHLLEASNGLAEG